MKIALTGGIACGKSTFAKFLRELGIRVIDADDIVHELESPGGAAVPAIAAEFGDGVVAPDGGIDRAKLAEIVFLGSPSPQPPNPEPRVTNHEPRATNHEPRTTSHEPRATNHEPRATSHEPRTTKQALESILFPLVRERLREYTETSPLGVFSIAIIPLLFESHFDEDYDIIIAIASSEDRQIDRMMRTRGYSRAQAEARLAAQMPVAEKAARAHFVVVNDSTPENLKNEATRLVAWLEEKAKHEH
jgi:dephospho-CoA kinase